MHDLLGRLWLDLEGLSEKEAVARAREEYVRLYLDKGVAPKRLGVRMTHDGQEVIFFEDRFEHAFYAPRKFAKDRFDLQRAQRLPWIGPLIAGELDGTECWIIPPKGNRRYQGNRPPNRFYLLRSELYVVWLEPLRSGGWKFSSAYPAGTHVWRYCREGRRLWEKSTP